MLFRQKAEKFFNVLTLGLNIEYNVYTNKNEHNIL